MRVHTDGPGRYFSIRSSPAVELSILLVVLQPTLNYGNSCFNIEHPFIGKCSYDAAYEILNHIYGGLKVGLISPISGTHGGIPYPVSQQEQDTRRHGMRLFYFEFGSIAVMYNFH